jgi:diguanylate cyclase (GGDEF)-like protein
VRTLTMRDGLPNLFVRTIRRSRDGSLWIGTDVGLARLRGSRAESMGVAEGLPSAAIRSMIEDREGSLWVGTTGGLVRLTATRVLSFTRKEGLPVDAIRAIFEARNGGIWVGTEGGGLCEVLPGHVLCRTEADGLPHGTVYALIESRDGSFWVGTDGGGVARFRDGRFVETINARNAGLPSDRVRALVETAQGDLWVSMAAGLALVHNGRATRIKEFEDRQLRPLLALPDGSLLVGTDGAGLWRVNSDGSKASIVASLGRGLQSDRVFSLKMDAEGKGVWIGTSGGGLARLDLANGSVRSLTRRDGLHDDVVFEVVDAGAGADLWLTSNRGVYRVQRDRVLAAMMGKKSDLAGTVYGMIDGMPSAECNGAFPGAMRSRDGRIWIATSRGLAVIDPNANVRNEVPPPVRVEEALIDGGVQAAGDALRVPPGSQRLELRYTALSLRAPELVTFRYLLEGYDRGWVEAGTNRVATYTKLAPGSYTFHVTATNEDGVRSGSEARLVVIVEPQWFETWWARLLGLALLAAAVWGIVRLRLVALHARHAELEALVAERTSSLAVANERLSGLSYLDGLTGVANRRRFDEALEVACASANERNEPLSLILLDLDHFKKLNDSQGHQDGDEALRSVAALLAGQTKSRGGLAARFGGEEFAWLLPGVTLNEAKAEAETLRTKIRDAGIRHAAAEQGVVTASFGVSAGAGMTPPALVAAADTALYRAKSGGRDRVETEDCRGLAQGRSFESGRSRVLRICCKCS